jgi:hypothetical protein
MKVVSANFEFLASHGSRLVQLGGQAERYFEDDPNTCLLKLRQFGEVLAQTTAAKSGLIASPEEQQADLLKRIERIVPSQPFRLFHQLRKAGNRATHSLSEDRAEALRALKAAHELGIWFHQTFADRRFVASAFVSSPSPIATSEIKTVSALQRPAGALKPVGVSAGCRQIEPHTGQPGVSTLLPECDWVYFATTARSSGTVTAEFVATQKIIVRGVYNANGQRIANVQHLTPGQRILLVHGGPGTPYRALFSGTITAAAVPVRTAQHYFDAFLYIDESLHEQLKADGYDPDPVLGRFTGISLAAVRDLRSATIVIPRPYGSPNTIWRWDKIRSLMNASPAHPTPQPR